MGDATLSPVIVAQHLLCSCRGVSVFGLPTISPTGYVVLVQLIVMGCLDATYTAFKVPISFAVNTNRTSWSLNNAVDLAAGIQHLASVMSALHALCVRA